MYDWLKFIHVLAATVWVGGAVILVVFGMRLAADPGAPREQRIAFTRNAQFAGTIFTVAALVALAFGMWMVVDADLDWGATWITLGFTGIALGAALGMGFYGPQNRKLLAELAAGEETAAAARIRRIGMVSMTEVLVLIVVVWAMVFKPGA